jgi:predicted O-methyltransferase YrrM
MAEVPTATELRRFIEALYARGTIRGEDATEHRFLPMSVTPDRGAFVRDVCRAERATSVLEIGMAWGLSTLHILESLLSNGADARAHVVVDPHQSSRFHGAGKQVLREAGVEQFVEFHQQYSELLLPQLLSEGRVFDFVFVDGLHRFDHVFVDLFYAHRLLKPGGVVVLDDAFADSVNFACRFVRTNYDYLPVAQHPADAPPFDDDSAPAAWRPMMVVLRKPAEEVQRDRFHFVPFFPRPPHVEQEREGHPAPAMSKAPEPKVRASILRHNARLALRTRGGDRIAARRDLVEALRLEPFHLKAYMRLIGTFLPQRMVRALSASARGEK